MYGPDEKLITTGKYRGTYDFTAPKTIWDIPKHHWDDVDNHKQDTNVFPTPDLTQVINCSSCSDADFNY